MDNSPTLLDNILLVWCPIYERNAVAAIYMGQYVCRACEQGEGDQDSSFHGVPRD